MKITSSLTLLALSLSLLGEVGSAVAGAEDSPKNKKHEKDRLPGAVPVVRAIEYSSLQKAIEAVPKEGGKVKLPPGQFEISKPLVVRQQEIRIEGAGGSTEIKNTNRNGKPSLLIQPPSGQDEKNPEPQWRVQLSHFRITGNDKSGPGIVAEGVNEIFIHNLMVNRHGDDGILLDHCYENPRVTDSSMTYNNGTGLHLKGCHDIVVNGNQFEENQDALRCIDGFNLCMTGNNLDDHLGNGVIIENTYGSVVSGNMIEECNGMAVIMDRDCYGNTIASNVIAHNGGGIDLRDAHGCAISANTFTIMKQDALRVGPKSARLTITGNNFSDSYIGNGKLKRNKGDRAAKGMTLESTKNLTVSGNVFSGVHPKAIELKGDPSRQILFSDNALIDTKSDHNRLTNSVIDNILQIPSKESN